MVFSDRKFIVVRDEPGSRADRLEELIKTNGGEIVNWDERADVDVSPKLVVVANSIDYDRSDEMRRFLVPTVTPQWIYTCIEEGKLVPHRPYSPDPRNFLKDAIVCFSGLSESDSVVFEAGVRANGGECSKIVTRYTTHVVALSLNTDECQLVLQSRENNDKVCIKLVRPEWLDDCMKLQCLVDDSPYLLDSESAAAETNLVGTFPVKDSPRLAVQQSVRESLHTSTLADKKFYLSSDLGLGEVVARTVKYLIETNGGLIEPDINNADVYLGRWREGAEYNRAYSKKLVIGNITWLYWMTIHQKFEKPVHLLHYPETKNGLPSMKGLSICITNYTGDARAYLQSLIHSIGANYSGKLIERHTTHLITAYEGGPKFDAAKRWNIPVINHLWLEDSYAYWQRQDEQSRLYTYFPQKLSLSTLVGTRHLVPQALNKRESLTRLPHPKRQAKQKAGDWLHDAMIVESEYLKKLKRGHIPIDDTTANQSDDGDSDKTNESDVSKSEVGKTEDRKGNSVDDVNGISKESSNDTSNDTSNVKDKTGAPQDTSKDVFKETPKNANTVNESSKLSQPQPKTRSSSPKSQSLTPNTQKKTVRVLFTGLEDVPTNKELLKVGISNVKTSPDVVVAPRFLKTAKFLQFLASAESFVTPLWIDACIAERSVVPLNQFLIKDPQLELALSNRTGLDDKTLFEGKVFRLVPSLNAKLPAFKTLVKAHGGTVVSRETDKTITIGDEVSFDAFIDAIHAMDASKLYST